MSRVLNYKRHSGLTHGLICRVPELLKGRDMHVKFVRDENRKPFGCVVALDANHIGWSQCRPRKNRGDHWDKDEARRVAIERAHNAQPIDPDVFNSLTNDRDRRNYVFGQIDPENQPTQRTQDQFLSELAYITAQAINAKWVIARRIWGFLQRTRAERGDTRPSLPSIPGSNEAVHRVSFPSL